MRAAIINSFGEPEVLEIAEAPMPEINDDQVLVKTYAGSVNPIDWKQRKGNHKFFMGSNFPITLGYDTAGIIEQVGSKVKNLKPGDRVCGVLNNKYGGAYAEYVAGDENCFALLPKSIDFSTGAVLPMVGLTVLQALRKIGLKSNSHILVNGAAGGVGHVAVQLAKHMGAKVTAITSAVHVEMVQQYQPDEIIDYKVTDILSSDIKYDIFFDSVGIYSYPQIRHMLNNGGIYYTTLPRPKLLKHKLKALFSKGHKVRTSLMKHSAVDLIEIVRMAEEGILKINIDKSFQLEEVSKAHAYMQQGHTEGKISLRIRE